MKAMKKCYLISYDMAEDGDYEALYDAIKGYGNWARITESFWAVVTEQSASQIRDALIEYLPDSSRLFVVKSGVQAAWRNVICKNAWLKKYL
jgi:hypothetical protein